MYQGAVLLALFTIKLYMMKKMFTLFMATAILQTAFAQYEQKNQREQKKENDRYVLNDDRDYTKYDKGYHVGYFFTARERDMQINQINRTYDYKIRVVKNNYFINWHQKKQIIKKLDAQRDNEIREVIYKFNDRRNQFENGYRRDRYRHG